MTSYRGSCFCGAVEVETTGAPAAMGYCHCSSCRSWAAAPVNAFTLWPPETVRVTRGAEHVGAHVIADIVDGEARLRGGHGALPVDVSHGEAPWGRRTSDLS